MMSMSRKVIDGIVHSAYNALQTEVGIKKLSDNTSAPNRYGEILYPKYGAEIKFTAHVTFDPSEIKLNELGWQKDDAKVILRVPHVELRKVGLAKETGELNFNTDVMLVINGKDYELSKLHLKEPFLNNVPIYVWLGGRTPNGRST